MAEPPYGVIWKNLLKGRVIPFLGSGASFVGRPPKTPWNPDAPAFLPSSEELANYLAGEVSFPSSEPRDRGDLAKVASYYEDMSGRRTLRECLHQVLQKDFSPGALHSLLAEIPAPLLLVSTNYDSLLEAAFRQANRPYDLVVYPADHKEIANAVLWWRDGETSPETKNINELTGHDLDGKTVIYKMHGTISRQIPPVDDFVVTEEDYVEFLSRMTTSAALPAFFFERCEGASFLFLGYSLKDWNLRVILRNLSKRLSARAGRLGDERAKASIPDPVPSWAIQKDPPEIEARFWERRGVTIFAMTVEKFAEQMREHRPRS